MSSDTDESYPWPAPGHKRSSAAAAASDVSTTTARIPYAPLDRTRQAALDHALRSRMALKNVPAVLAFHSARDEFQRTLSYLGLISTDVCQHIIVPMLSTGYVGVVTTDKPPKIPVQLAPATSVARIGRPNTARANCVNRTASLYPTRMLAPLFTYRFTCSTKLYRGKCSSCAVSKCSDHKFSHMAFDGLHNRASIITAPRSQVIVDLFRVALLPTLGELSMQCPDLPKVTSWTTSEPSPGGPKRRLERHITTACMLPNGNISGMLHVFETMKDDGDCISVHRSRFEIQQPEIPGEAIMETGPWSCRPRTTTLVHLSRPAEAYVPPPAAHNQVYTNITSNGPFQSAARISLSRFKILGSAIEPSGAWPALEIITEGRQTRLTDSPVQHITADATFRLPFREVPPPMPGLEETNPGARACEHLRYTTSENSKNYVLFCDSNPTPSVFYLMGLVVHGLSSTPATQPFSENVHYCVFVYSTKTLQCIKVIHLDVTPLPTLQRIDQYLEFKSCHVDGAGNFVLFTDSEGDAYEYGPTVIVWSPTGKFIKKAILVIPDMYTAHFFLTNDGLICGASCDAKLSYYCLDDEEQITDDQALAIMELADDLTAEPYETADNEQTCECGDEVSDEWN